MMVSTDNKTDKDSDLKYDILITYGTAQFKLDSHKCVSRLDPTFFLVSL